MKLTVAVAQAAPVVLDLAGCVARACDWIREAGRRGAQVLAFPETWLPAYPLWCDAGRFSQWGNPQAKRLHARLAENSLVIPSAATEVIAKAAREAKCAVVLGANELGRSGSLYNALVFWNAAGELIARHRKLVPTFGERLVWGYGDASALRVHSVATGAGTLRLGGLICWEHWMPLPRHVLHSEGEQVHVAAWPHVGEVHQIASRHYAFEGRAFVLAAGIYLEKKMLPPDFEMADEFTAAPDVLMDGGSAIIGPDAQYVVEPVRGREEMLVAELDLRRLVEEKLVLDTAGHYSRPDLFELRVRRMPLTAVHDETD